MLHACICQKLHNALESCLIGFQISNDSHQAVLG
jgi:hypothetical protein